MGQHPSSIKMLRITWRNKSCVLENFNHNHHDTNATAFNIRLTGQYFWSCYNVKPSLLKVQVMAFLSQNFFQTKHANHRSSSQKS